MESVLQTIIGLAKAKSPASRPLSSERSIAEANRLSFEKVFGWVGPRIHQIVEFADEFHTEFGIKGDIAEIGVHHGKLFFIIAAALEAGEKAIAIDLFEAQEKNVDRSGQGSIDIFSRHLQTDFAALAPHTKIVARDSLSITPLLARSVISDGVRLFSVDGGHTVTHVVNDLAIADEILVAGGVVMLDDFFGPHWPSVTEGYFKYMASHNKRLAPFLIFQNKLFMTTYSEHFMMIDRLDYFLRRRCSDEFPGELWKISEITQHKIMCFAG